MEMQEPDGCFEIFSRLIFNLVIVVSLLILLAA